MNNNSASMLLLPTEGSLLFLSIADIVRIEAKSNYCRLHFSDGRYPLTVAKTLSWFEHQPVLASFVRIHRTHFINPLHIKNYRSRAGILLLHNNEIFCVARRRKLALKEQFIAINTNNQSLSFKLLTNKTIAA
jgi:two-component system LytT family response regulator